MNVIEQLNREFRETLARLDTAEHPAQEIINSCNRQFHERGAVILTPSGNKPFPVFIKPYFLTREQMNEVERVSNIMMTVLEKVTDLYFAGDEFKPLFNLTEKEAELCEVHPGTQRKVWITRNDAFMTDKWLKFIEFNTDSPGGPMYSDAQTEIIESTIVMKELARRYRFASDRFMPVILRNLTEAYTEFCSFFGKSRKPHPNIAIVSDKGATYPEFLMIVAAWRAQGVNVTFCEPPEVQYDGRVATTPDGMEIDIIYRRGWIRNWTDVYDKILPLRRAYADHSVCCVNSIRSILGTIKSLLGVMQRPEIQKAAGLNKEELKVLRDHVPWTRLMRPVKTEDFKGKLIDLYEFVSANRERLVLKPMDLYGGKDVCVGPAVTQSQWDEWVEKSTKANFVAQEYVPIPEEELPVVSDKGVKWESKKMNQNFYAFGGRHAGGMVRTSDSPVINISAGGGLTPILIVEPKK